MAVKMTGAEWNAWMADKAAWPDGAYYEDEDMKIDGVQVGDDGVAGDLAADAKVSISGGRFYESDGPVDWSNSKSFEAVARRWLKARSVETIVVEINRDDAAAFRVLVGSFRNARIIK
jgi:hypothetical protein